MMHYSYSINLSEEDKKVLEAIVQFRNTHERFSKRRISRADVFRTALLRYRDDLAEQYPEARDILYPDDDIRIEKLLKEHKKDRDQNECKLCSLDIRKEVCLADSSWCGLYTHKDENGRLYLDAEGETITEEYYPKYCPECGKKLD